jgi:hypothetical protein
MMLRNEKRLATSIAPTWDTLIALGSSILSCLHFIALLVHAVFKGDAPVSAGQDL